jgi:hypothetical protein
MNCRRICICPERSQSSRDEEEVVPYSSHRRRDKRTRARHIVHDRTILEPCTFAGRWQPAAIVHRGAAKRHAGGGIERCR